MKIALVCRAYVTQRPGGMLHVLEDRAKELARQGHEVWILTTGHEQLGCCTLERTSDARSDWPDNLHVVHLNCPAAIYSEQFASELVGWFHQRPRFDVLHLDSLDRDRRWWQEVGATIKACTMHGFGLGSLLTDWNLEVSGRAKPIDAVRSWDAMRKEQQALRSFDVQIGHCLWEAWQMLDVYRLPGARLVYNPIGPMFFEDSQPQTPQRDFLMGAFSGHSMRGLELAREAGKMIGATVEGIQGATRDMMPNVYRDFRACVLPTYYSQSLDLTLIESLSQRRPIIVSATGAYFWEASRLPGVIVVPRDDVKALSNAMYEIKQGHGPIVPADTARRWHPAAHVVNWLRALTCSSRDAVEQITRALQEAHA